MKNYILVSGSLFAALVAVHVWRLADDVPLASCTPAFPNSVSTSEQVARAMIRVTRDGAEKPVMEVRDINA